MRGGCGVAGGERDPLGPLCRAPGLPGAAHWVAAVARFSFDDLFAMGVDRIHMDARETTVRIVCGMGGRIVGEPAAFYRGTVTPVVLERHAYRAI